MALNIDLTKSSVVINGTELTVPFGMDKVKALLGDARQEDEKHYFYDESGVMFTVRNGEVTELAIKMKYFTDPDFIDPTKAFNGELTICGEDWFSFMLGGENKTLLSERACGDFMVLSFTDMNPENWHNTDRDAVISVILQLYSNDKLEEFIFEDIGKDGLEELSKALF